MPSVFAARLVAAADHKARAHGFCLAGARCLPLWLFLVLGLITGTAQADSIARLDAYLADLEAFSADFEQTLYDEDSSVIETRTGQVQIKKPGRFVWRYTDPADQSIVADGHRIWLYDIELAQVTVSDIDQRIGGTPLLLLMGGSTALRESFELNALGESEGIDWVELVPNDEAADFEAVFIGLNEQGLAAMELRDSFGQATQIRFSNVEPSPELDDSLFVFEPPEGVDVIGDGG